MPTPAVTADSRFMPRRLSADGGPELVLAVAQRTGVHLLTLSGEDYGPDGTSSYSGAAVTTWAEFMLKPVNLFDGTPFYPVKPAPTKKK